MKKNFNFKFENLNISRVIAITTLKLNREVSRKEVADALGITPQHAVREKDKPLSDEQIKKIEKYFNINLTVSPTQNADLTIADKIELQYWGQGLPCEDKLKNPLIVTPMWFDRKLINGGWQKDEQNLNIIAMPGDKMDGGDIPFKNGDILVIDTAQTDISISGIYFYTTNNNEDVFVNNFRKRFDGTVVLGYTNSKYEDSIVTIDQLEAAGYNVIGRVIKNMFAMI